MPIECVAAIKDTKQTGWWAFVLDERADPGQN